MTGTFSLSHEFYNTEASRHLFYFLKFLMSLNNTYKKQQVFVNIFVSTSLSFVKRLHNIYVHECKLDSYFFLNNKL